MLSLLDFANDWVEKGGLVVLGAIVFAESGLLAGFFLPGDSLLFFAGFLSSGPEGLPPFPALPWVALTCAVAAIVGDQVGYMIGAKFGSRLFQRPKSRFFNPEYVAKAEAFFAKHGSKTIVLARFVPIVRTFVPTVAGVSKMHYRTFVTYNVIGGVLWGAGITTLGYFLGEIEVVKNNIEVAAIVIVGVSVLPIAIELWRHRRAAAAAAVAAEAAAASAASSPN
ncbi:MAG: VTT domain-containing protein [Actinomycetota bacterium]|nr:VTT domain-containing protein [Actinomycetota bacterium]